MKSFLPIPFVILSLWTLATPCLTKADHGGGAELTYEWAYFYTLCFHT